MIKDINIIFNIIKLCYNNIYHYLKILHCKDRRVTFLKIFVVF